MFMHWDPTYIFYVLLPVIAATVLTQLWVKSVVGHYSKVPNSSGVSGAEAAMGILREAGIHDVKVEMHQGWLSDHYDPRHKVIRLSSANYSGRTITAVGIAAHEVGHAIQHARGYVPLALRNAAVPLAGIGSNFGYLVIVLGIMMGSGSGSPVNTLTLIGVGLIGAVAFFQLVNLPVEFNASRRALQILPQMGILTREENAGAKHILTAAAMTYVAATAGAVLELLYWLVRLGIIGGGRSSND